MKKGNPILLVLVLCAAAIFYTNKLGTDSVTQSAPASSTSSNVDRPNWLQTSNSESGSSRDSSKNSSSDTDSPSWLQAGDFSSDSEDEPRRSGGGPLSVQPPPSVPKVDAAVIQNELNTLAANRPQVLISCAYCGGTGRVGDACASCGGTGMTSIPGVTMFAAAAPCTACRGNGYAICSQCTLGLIENPNYEADSAAWTQRRHELWGMLGYTEEEIRQLEIEEAQAYLGVSSDSGASYGGSYSELDTGERMPGICRICYGTGDCPTCDGDRLYTNVFTGGQIVCPNCTDGLCWKCGGTGQGT